MAFKTLALALLLPLLFTVAVSYDVQQSLAGYSQYSTFLKLLADTKIADDITTLHKATILVVDNSAAGALSSLPIDQVKQILSLHVILDYFDFYYFSSQPHKTALIATLLHNQVSGNSGYLNISITAQDEISIGNGAAGSPQDSKLLNVLNAKPSAFCVLQVSALIMPSDSGSASPAMPSDSASSAAPTHPPAESATEKTPASEKTSMATPPPQSSSFQEASPDTPSSAPQSSSSVRKLLEPIDFEI